MRLVAERLKECVEVKKDREEEEEEEEELLPALVQFQRRNGRLYNDRAWGTRKRPRH